jgi:glycosyltransferase involved in cell wall biosynthesis
MKISIVIPCWHRPEITTFCFKELKRLIEEVQEHTFNVLCVISEDEFVPICESFGFKWLMFPNDPLGKKINAGCLMALTEEPDYLMTMNSDSVVKKELFDYYRPYFEKKEQYFGVDRVTFVDSVSGEGKDYTYDFTILGVAKCMRADIVAECFKALGCLYPNNQNRGLDNKMMDNLIKIKVTPKMVPYEGQLVFDVKSEVNIWPYEHFKNRGTVVKPELCYKAG